MPSQTAAKITVMPPTKSKNGQPARTQAKLRDALVALLSTSPFDEITVNQIVDQAKVGYATFFRHYPDRRALWVDVTNSLVRELTALCQSVEDDKPTLDVARIMVEFVVLRYNVFSALLSGRAVTLARDEIIRQCALENANLTYSFGPIPAELIHSHAVNGILGLLSWWMSNPDRLDAATMTELIDKLVFQPLVAMRTP